MKKNTKKHSFVYLVLIMFITVTYASFNTNLFIDGRAYVTANGAIRITNVELVETIEDATEYYEPEFTSDTITLNANLPKHYSTISYRVTITNSSDYDYEVDDIIEDILSNNDASFGYSGLIVDETVLSAHTTTTFLITLSNFDDIEEEEDVYETKTYTFDYTGGEQEFIAPYDGTYTLEVWGAQGGKANNSNLGGYGGYSKGEIYLRKGQTIYVVTGGQGNNFVSGTQTIAGGYNGGGAGKSGNTATLPASGGGGATHISTMKGTLSKLENYKNNILIVAGGGGGAVTYGTAGSSDYYFTTGGAGGGFEGQGGFLHSYSSQYTFSGAPTGGTQTAGGVGNYSQNGTGSKIYSTNGTFGQGGTGKTERTGGGGGGYYGGAGGSRYGGCGGSGYIGNNKLTNKEMYCYECAESSDENTKTTATTNHSSTPTPEYAKEGNGYAKITLTRKIEDGTTYDFDYTGGEQTFTAPYTGLYKLETWGAEGGYISVDSEEEYNKGNGGFGGYSKGNIKFNKNTKLYINVGGKGEGKHTNATGGYNGGGSAETSSETEPVSSGGGATHIASVSGLLKVVQKNSLYIVSGGGGGAFMYRNSLSTGGSGGGMVGTVGTNDLEQYPDSQGGTQTAGGERSGWGQNGSYGKGGNGNSWSGAGGGGLYGGGGGFGVSGAGGSGYIGNTSLTDKVMYCYKCQESQDINTRTVSTNSHSSTPTQNVAKEGNGYSRITLLKRELHNVKMKLKINFVKKVEITYDYQYPYDYFIKSTTNNSLTFSGFSETRTENVCTNSLGKLYLTDWKAGDKVEFNYDLDYANMAGVEGGSRPTSHMQGNGNVTNWTGKLYSRGESTYLGTNTKHILDYATLTSTQVQNDYYNISFRFDDYIAGTITISNISMKRVSKDSSKIRVTQNLGTLPTPDFYNNEYEFVGWYDAPTGGNKISNNASIPDTNKTYYAHWNKIYDITYDLDGGSFGNNAVHPDTYTKDSSTFTISNPTKSGYEFKGWSEKNLYNYDNAVYYQSSLAKGTDQDDYQYKRVLSYSSNIWPMFSLEYLNLEEGETYTLSFDIWADTDYEFVSKSLSINNRTSATHNLDGITTTRQKLKGTFVYHDPQTNSHSYIFVHTYPQIERNATGNIYIDNVQLEKGSNVTNYEGYTGSNLTINNGSSGNRTLKAEWKDAIAPTVSLTKETYLEGYDGWDIDANHSVQDGVLIMNNDGSSWSPYIVTNGGKWRMEFEAYSSAVASNYTDVNKGSYYSRTLYYDQDYVQTTAINGYNHNGGSDALELNEWHNVVWQSNGSYGNDIKYTKFGFTVGGGTGWAIPPLQIRNLKIYGEAIPNSFYDIKVTASDNVGIREVRYLEGSKTLANFRSNGTKVNNNTLRVTANGIYTIYVADADDNAVVQQIEITNIQ